MTAQQLKAMEDIQELPQDDADSEWEMMDGIMTGEEPLDISHEGGKFSVLMGLREELASQRTR